MFLLERSFRNERQALVFLFLLLTNVCDTKDKKAPKVKLKEDKGFDW
jgi:hypothetical protein